MYSFLSIYFVIKICQILFINSEYTKTNAYNWRSKIIITNLAILFC